MDTPSLYDKVLKSLLDIPVIAYFLLICVVLIAIPQIREGIVFIFSCFKSKNKDFVLKYSDETITFEELLLSRDFDIIRINATTHRLGVSSEYEWLSHKYPGHIKHMQRLTQIQTNTGEKVFDIIQISIGAKNKDIYFDISSFYNGAYVPFTEKPNDYAIMKVKELYK